jgi:hypothetical protein
MHLTNVTGALVGGTAVGGAAVGATVGLGAAVGCPAGAAVGGAEVGAGVGAGAHAAMTATRATSAMITKIRLVLILSPPSEMDPMSLHRVASEHEKSVVENE